MQLLDDDITDHLASSLKEILPNDLSEFVYQVIDGYTLQIWFIPESMPDDNQFRFLTDEVTKCIDAILPVYKGIPTWFANVVVGGKRDYDSISGGVNVFTFWGKTTDSPSDFWFTR